MAKKESRSSRYVFSPIDYLEIIDGYTPDTLKLCVKHLFPLFELKILTEQDIRSVDLKEQVLRLINTQYPSSDEQLSSFSAEYLQELHFLLHFMIKTEKNSRAQRYWNRALELLDLQTKNIFHLQDYSDALLMYVALLKPLRGHIASFENKCTQDPIFSHEPADIDILDEVWSVLYEAFSSSILGFKKKSDNNDLKKAKSWYIISTVLYCHILQEHGVFASEVG